MIDITSWAEILPLFRLALACLEGYGAVPAVNYLKNKWAQLTGRKLPAEFSLLLTFAVCLILTALTLIVEGALTPESLGPTELVATFVTVFTVAKVRYDMLKKKKARKIVGEQMPGFHQFYID